MEQIFKMIWSAEEFVRLRISDRPEEYRRSVLEEASEEVWIDIIQHYPEMKIWVIRNKTIPLSILRLLSNDSDNHVRGEVAMKRKLDNELFEKLAHDEDEAVRAHIACNRKTPIEILILLSTDAKKIVRDAAQKRLNMDGGN